MSGYENKKVEQHHKLCAYLTDLYARKNHDYGDSFHQTFEEEGMAMARIRLGDKFGRFKTLTKYLEGKAPNSETSQQVADESVRDTLLDLANYAIMTVMEMDLAVGEKLSTREKANVEASDDSTYRYDFSIKDFEARR